MIAIAALPRSSSGHRVRLDHGRWASIRPIEACDADGLSAFYATLSPDAHHARFLSMGVGIDSDLAASFASVDHRRRDGFVAILHECGSEDGAIVGHASMEPLPGGEEIAFAVSDRFQHLGIGTALMEQVLASARRRGVRRLTAITLMTNEPMRRLALHAGPPVRQQPLDVGIDQLELDLAA